MKNFVEPEMLELNINETANGFFGACFEFCIFTHSNKQPSDPSDNVNEEKKEEVVNSASGN